MKLMDKPLKVKDSKDTKATINHDETRANQVANACHIRGYKCLEDSGTVAKTYVQQPSCGLCE